MKCLLIVFKVGSWSYILVGLGHLVTSMSVPVTAERVEIIQAMKDFPIVMLGTESNLYLFHEGFSLMMGFLLFAYGLLNLLVVRKNKIPSKDIIAVNIVVSLVALALSIRYFFIVPIFFLGTALLCFAIALAVSNNLNSNVTVEQ